MKRLGIALLVTGTVLYWMVVLDPVLGLSIYFQIIGTTLVVNRRVK